MVACLRVCFEMFDLRAFAFHTGECCLFFLPFLQVGRPGFSVFVCGPIFSRFASLSWGYGSEVSVAPSFRCCVPRFLCFAGDQSGRLGIQGPVIKIVSFLRPFCERYSGFGPVSAFLLRNCSHVRARVLS